MQFRNFHWRMHLKNVCEMVAILSWPQCVNIINPLRPKQHFGQFVPWGFNDNKSALVQIMDWHWHSVESPSMVDPQWDIWYWGSKWNLHTVCWSAVGCEWGTTSVYFGITYVCFIPSRLPVFAVEPQYLLQDFLFLSKVSFEGHIQNLQTISCWFKIWMRFVGPILIKLWTSCIWGFP